MLAEVAAASTVPLVVLLDKNVPGQAQERGGVGESANDVGGSFEALMSSAGADGVADHGAVDRV